MRTDPDAQAMQPGCCYKCGLPYSENPHPDAGKPARYIEVGTKRECIPCTVLNRHQWARRAMKAERELATLRERLAQSRDGEAKPVAEMVHFRRVGNRMDCIPVMPGTAKSHVRQDLITRIELLYTTPTAAQTDAIRMGLEAAAKVCEDIYSWRGAYTAGSLHSNTLNACAAAIRAIKPEDALGGGPK